MLRPRESPDLLLLNCDIQISPTGRLAWTSDVFGNAIATATFVEPTCQLEIISKADVDLRSEAWPVFDIAASAINYPFKYHENDWRDLGSLRDVQHDPTVDFQRWVKGFVMGNTTDTLSLLRDLSSGVANHVTYQSRDAEGTQTPVETLALGSGSCRDYAALFAEAVRVLGLGARTVSGYLYSPTQDLCGSSLSGSTHAWVEVFLPGAGWVPFDPTNRSVGSGNLIPVSVGRDITQAIPVSGGFSGPGNALCLMEASVEIS